MKILIDPTNKTYKILAKVIDLYFLNMLFLATCGLGLLIGPASIATYSITYSELNNQDTHRVRRYFEEYKKNFWRGLVLEAIIGVLIGIMIISYRCASVLSGIQMLISLSGLFLAGIVTLIWSILIFPYTAHYCNSTIQTFKVCFQVAMLNFKKLIYFFAILVFIWLISSINNFFFALIFVLTILIGFSGLAYINSLLVYPVFRKYEH